MKGSSKAAVVIIAFVSLHVIYSMTQVEHSALAKHDHDRFPGEGNPFPGSECVCDINSDFNPRHIDELVKHRGQ
jgi:hypothetical protein